MAQLARAGFDWDDLGYYFEQCRFTCTVGANQDDALFLFDLYVEVFVDDVFAIGLLYMVKRNYTLTATLRLGKLKVDCVSGTLRWRNALHFL